MVREHNLFLPDHRYKLFIPLLQRYNVLFIEDY